MRVRTWLALSVPVALATVLAGCGGPAAPQGGGNKGDASPTENPNADVGGPLFKPADAPKIAAAPPKFGEPMVIPNCTVQYEERQQVAADVDGRIDLIAVLDPTIDLNDPNCVFHPRDPEKANEKKVRYRRLREGDTVRKGDILCQLDDQVMTTRRNAAFKTMETSKKVIASAQKGVDLTDDKLKYTKEVLDKGSGSKVELLNDMITLTRFVENLAQAEQAVAKAEAEYLEAGVMIGKHRITSYVDGIIRGVVKQPGDFVKAGDKILEIQATDRVRLEGNLDVQYANLVKRGTSVTVEPALNSAPAKSSFSHRQEVTGIAVTPHAGRPLVVSTSADGSAIVWDANRDASHNLAHPVPVRCVAISPVATKAIFAVTGADDGKVRIWDLTNPDKLPATPAKEPADAHSAAITAAAVCPNGKFFATAAGREIFVWDLETGKKLYALPAEHRDTITTLAFTPQCTLVTAAKDRTIKVWKLGAEKAAVAKSIDHRAGAVDILGISRDGGRVVFDQDKTRLDLVSLADKQTVGQIQNMGSTAAFATLALFSADDSLLVTAGGEGELRGVLQMWNTPGAGGRGSEVARLVTPGRVGVTTAAFSPVKEAPFLVVGTDKGSVHLWKPPSDARKTHTGKVVNVDSTDPRYVTVRVEMGNKELNLLDRSAATIIITPGQ